MGGSVPGTGPNRQTETDTTIFRSRDAASDGLGRTKGNGENTLAMMSNALAQSGNTLPQVSSKGGYINMTYHIVTTVCPYLSSNSLVVSSADIFRTELALLGPLSILPPLGNFLKARKPMLSPKFPAIMAISDQALSAIMWLVVERAAFLGASVYEAFLGALSMSILTMYVETAVMMIKC